MKNVLIIFLFSLSFLLAVIVSPSPLMACWQECDLIIEGDNLKVEITRNDVVIGTNYFPTKEYQIIIQGYGDDCVYISIQKIKTQTKSAEQKKRYVVCECQVDMISKKMKVISEIKVSKSKCPEIYSRGIFKLYAFK